MNKRIKRILILIFAALFFLAVPATILYCQGYRFDFGNKKIVKTGAFFFQAEPKSCEVYLDGKLIKKTDFLSGSVFIKNLLPKEYTIKIEKEGYFSWEKKLGTEEEMVTEAKNIILFSKNSGFSVFLSDINDYFFSPDQKKVILKKIEEPDWKLDIFDLKKNSQEIFLGEKDLSKKEVVLLDLNWDSYSEKLLLKTKIEEKIKYFIVDLSGEKKQIFPLENNDIAEISFNPDNFQEIFFIKNSNLYKFNFVENKILEETLKNLLTYRISNGNIFWLSQDGFLNRSDFSGKRLETLNATPFPVKENLEYTIEVFPSVVFLKEDEDLYQFNSSLKSFEKFCESVKNLKLSPDSKELVIANNYEIWIIFLADISEQPQRKTGQKIFLTRFSQKIDEIFWLNPNYLIFNTDEKIKIAEADDRNGINIVELGEFQNPKIFWNQTYGKLYLLSQEKLFISGNLLP